MKFLITGGAGFIGSHLVDFLLAEGHHVTVVDNFDPFYERSIKEENIRYHQKSKKYKLFEVDIRNRDKIFDVFNDYQPEVVIHLAAKAGVRPSVEDPLQYVEVNINGTVNLLDASVKYGVRKFIFASSSSVYGLNEKVPFSELDPTLNQASPYGATKAAGEALCRSYSNCYSLPIVALRFFTVYGPRQRPDLAIHKFSKMIINNQKVPVFGDGTTCRDYTFIKDIVDGIVASIYYELDGYEVFNLGNDRPTKLIDLISIIEKTLKKESQKQLMPAQTGDVPKTWADITKSGIILRYKPSVPIEEGINKFIVWIKGVNKN